VLPVFYDSNIRKALQALVSCYKDFLVYLLFFSIVIVAFGIIANQIIQLPPDAKIDPYADNYPQLDKSIFLMYVLSTYDNFPDDEENAIDAAPWISVFFTLFIILNIFFFNPIPNTILYNSFRDTRSKIILVDEIKQQHSLVMCFVCIGEDNLNISQKKAIRFMLYVYRNKIRYINHVNEICRKLDDNNNGVVHVNEFMQLCKIMQADRSMLPPRFDDWQWWVKFRGKLKEKFNLKRRIQSRGFKIVVISIILITFVNSILALFTTIEAFAIIDNALIAAFVC
jgi:hypothetical protein